MYWSLKSSSQKIDFFPGSQIYIFINSIKFDLREHEKRLQEWKTNKKDVEMMKWYCMKISKRLIFFVVV